MGHNTGVCEIKSFGPFLLFLLVLQEEREIIFSVRARRRGENGGIFIIFIFSFFFGLLHVTAIESESPVSRESFVILSEIFF